MPSINCSSCSASITIKPEIIGKRVKCPTCKTINDTNAMETLPQKPKTAWLMLCITGLLALAIGGSAGFVFGHSQGKLHNRVEVEAAKRSAEAMEKKAVDAETKRNVIENELTKQAEKLTAISKERDTLLNAARVAEAEATAKRNTSERIQTSRANPRPVLFKDFVNFPDDYQTGCFRFERVWIDGDFERVAGSTNLSPGISSSDGKRIMGRRNLEYTEGIVFVVSENFGRPLSVKFSSDKKYSVNINCDVLKQGKIYLAKIYRIETFNLNGEVLDVYEDKE